MSFAAEKDPGISKDSIPRLHVDSQDNGIELEVSDPCHTLSKADHGHKQVFIESKLTPDISITDLHAWIERILKDALGHSVFALVVHKVGFIPCIRSRPYLPLAAVFFSCFHV